MDFNILERIAEIIATTNADTNDDIIVEIPKLLKIKNTSHPIEPVNPAKIKNFFGTPSTSEKQITAINDTIA